MSRTLRVEGHRLLIKPVTRDEIWRCSYFFPESFSKRDRALQIKAGVVALGLVMWGTRNLLPSRPSGLTTLVNSLKKLPAPLLDYLLSEISELSNSQAHAITLVYEFAPLAESRMMWSALRSLSLCDASWTGWEGTENLGVNLAQKIWAHLQVHLDNMDEFERMWQNTKCLVACVSKKAVDAMTRMEQQREALRFSMGRVSTGETKSSEELTEELERSLRGEQDEHDQAVIEQEEDIIQEYLRHEEALKKQREQFLTEELPSIVMKSQEIGEVPLRRRSRQIEVPEPSFMRQGNKVIRTEGN